MKVFNLMKEQLQIDFDNIIKTSSFTKRDIELKQNSLNEFIKTGFPNRRQENWKFSDLNQIFVLLCLTEQRYLFLDQLEC